MRGDRESGEGAGGRGAQAGQLPAPVMAGMLKISVPGWPISGGAGDKRVRPMGPQVLGSHLPPHPRPLSGLGKVTSAHRFSRSGAGLENRLSHQLAGAADLLAHALHPAGLWSYQPRPGTICKAAALAPASF